MLKYTYYYYHMCVCVFSMCPIVRTWNSQDNFQELAASFCYVLHVLNSGLQTCIVSTFSS